MQENKECFESELSYSRNSALFSTTPFCQLREVCWNIYLDFCFKRGISKILLWKELIPKFLLPLTRIKGGLYCIRPVRSSRIDLYSNHSYIFGCFSNTAELLMLSIFLALSSALFEPWGRSFVSEQIFYNDCFVKQMYLWVAWS